MDGVLEREVQKRASGPKEPHPQIEVISFPVFLWGEQGSGCKYKLHNDIVWVQILVLEHLNTS